MATVNLGVIKPVFKGAYNNSTAYVLDNIVTSGGSSYICILASTGNAVSNGTYWTQMSAAGTDVGTTITTAGDILYRDGSGLQRLAKGTARQALVMNSGATAPEWGTAGKVLQVVYDDDDAVTSGQTQNTWYLASLQATITPISTTSKFFIWYNIGVQTSNTSGDGGTSLRLQRTTGGSSTYPTYLSTYKGSGNQHSWIYTNGPPTSSVLYMMANIHAIDDQSHTTASITYRVQFASYNQESCSVGGVYASYPIITIMEVEQ